MMSIYISIVIASSVNIPVASSVNITVASSVNIPVASSVNIPVALHKLLLYLQLRIHIVSQFLSISISSP